MLHKASNLCVFVIKKKRNWCYYSKHILNNIENICRNTPASEKNSLSLGRDSGTQDIVSYSATAPVVIIRNFPSWCFLLHAGDRPLLDSLSSFPHEKCSMNYCRCFVSDKRTIRDSKKVV